MKHVWVYILLFVCFWGSVLCFAFLSRTVPQTLTLPTNQPATSSETATPTPTVVTAPIKLLFVGDMMFDRDIRLRMKQHGYDYILEKMAPFLTSFDVVVGNLEGPITDQQSRSVGSQIGSSSNFIFTFDPAVAPTIKQQGITIVNLGNNHILNFGVAGVTSTKTYLNQAQLPYFGDTSTEPESSQRTFTIKKQNITIGFANYNQFVPDGYQHAVDDIAFLRPQVDVLVLFTHWGNEYVPTANATITEQAHAFIDQGADVVIGTHPHVIQNSELYQGKQIFYSLGNFVFDQYFSPETQQGLAVEMHVNATTKELLFKEHYVRLDKSGQTKLLPSQAQ